MPWYELVPRIAVALLFILFAALAIYAFLTTRREAAEEAKRREANLSRVLEFVRLTRRRLSR